VTALGRLQPKDGIIRVAGTSRPTFAASIGVILDTWNEAGKARRLRPAVAS
jgi:hypothetical protein